jgi:hypothetical protein
MKIETFTIVTNVDGQKVSGSAAYTVFETCEDVQKALLNNPERIINDLNRQRKTDAGNKARANLKPNSKSEEKQVVSRLKKSGLTLSQVLDLIAKAEAEAEAKAASEDEEASEEEEADPTDPTESGEVLE